MAQPLPNWLKLVTLRYQDSNQFTTGLVELPITYSGPSIPIKWPYTSIASGSFTASPPLSSSAPFFPQVIKFIDGGGPFTVLGDVILTSSASLHPSPTTSTAMTSATPTPSVIIATTIVVTQPTNPAPISNNQGSPSSYLMEMGFVVMLITLVVLLFAVSIILIKRHKRRKNHANVVDKNCDCFTQDNHDNFDQEFYPRDPEGEQAPQNLTSDLRDAIPTLLRQHASLNAEIQEKKLTQPETQFLITPQRNPENHALGWMWWKKLITKFQAFGQRNAPEEIVCDQPLPHFIPRYSNPYHDPSIKTDTGERVSRWRMKCGSPSFSALRLPSTITSNKNDYKSDYKTPYSSLSEKDQALEVNYIEFTNQNQHAQENGCLKSTSHVRGPPGKTQSRDYQVLKDPTPSKGTRIDPVQRSLEYLSPTRGMSKSQSEGTKKSIIPSALIKASTHMSRSFGRTTGKRNPSKRYSTESDDSPPLLIANCEGDASESDGSHPGNCSPGVNKIPLRGPSRCQRATPASSPRAPLGLQNPTGSIRSPQSPCPSASSLPLACSAKKVRRKKSSLNASPRPSLSSPQSSTKPGNNHVSGFKLTPNSSQILPSLPATPTILPRKKAEPSVLKQPNSELGNPQPHNAFVNTTDNLSGRGANLDPRLEQVKNPRDGYSFPVETMPTTSKTLMKYRTDTFDKGLIIAPETIFQETANNNIHHSSNGNDIALNGYSGPRAIGNTGGVSELGNLETNGIETGINFHASSSHHPAPRSPPTSSGLLDGDGYSCKSADLFYVKPQARRASGGRRTFETSIEARSDWEFTRNC